MECAEDWSSTSGNCKYRGLLHALYSTVMGTSQYLGCFYFFFVVCNALFFLFHKHVCDLVVFYLIYQLTNDAMNCFFNEVNLIS